MVSDVRLGPLDKLTIEGTEIYLEGPQSVRCALAIVAKPLPHDSKFGAC